MSVCRLTSNGKDIITLEFLKVSLEEWGEG
jgi:hypothetical protein